MLIYLFWTPLICIHQINTLEKKEKHKKTLIDQTFILFFCVD